MTFTIEIDSDKDATLLYWVLNNPSPQEAQIAGQILAPRIAHAYRTAYMASITPQDTP